MEIVHTNVIYNYVVKLQACHKPAFFVSRVLFSVKAFKVKCFLKKGFVCHSQLKLTVKINISDNTTFCVSNKMALLA